MSLQRHFAVSRFTLPSTVIARREVAEMGGASGDEITVLEGWGEALTDVQRRIAHRFRRVEVRERAGRYLTGLLARVERKNGWQLAEAWGRRTRTASSGS